MNKMKRFFCSESMCGSSKSYGFCNDTLVQVFRSKKDRDDYVRNSENLSCKSIKRSEVTREATNLSLTENREIWPTPFTSECWTIVSDPFMRAVPGCIGCIDIGRTDDPTIIRL